MFTVNHFEKQDKIVRVDGNRTVEEVFADVQKAFDKLVAELKWLLYIWYDIRYFW